jgi:hypothetical protein
VSDHKPIFNLSPAACANLDDEPVFNEDTYDPTNLDSTHNKANNILVEKGPIREENIANGSYFSYTHYSRKMSKGEICDRKWSVYSKHVDRLFCFCKLFNSDNFNSSLGMTGLQIGDTSTRGQKNMKLVSSLLLT